MAAFTFDDLFEGVRQIQQQAPQPNLASTLPNAIATAPQTEEDLPPLLRLIMRGESAQPPPTFEEFLQKRQNPAQAIVDATRTAFMTSATGQRFKSKREQLLDEFTTQQQLNINREQIQAAQGRAIVDFTQTMNQIASREKVDQVSRAQKADEFGKKFGLEQQVKSLELGIQIRDLQNKETKTDADVELTQLKTKELENEFSKNQFLQTAADHLRHQGKNPQDVTVMTQELLPLAKQMMEAVSRKTGADLPKGFPVVQRVTDGRGQSRVAMVPGPGQAPFDAISGEAMLDMKDFSNQELERISKIEQAGTAMRDLFNESKTFEPQVINEVFSVFGEVMRMSPSTLQNFAFSPEALRISQKLKDIQLRKTNAITGAQVTDRERQFISQTLPSPIGGFGKFMGAMGMESSYLDATGIRQRLNIPASDLDFSPELKKIQDLVNTLAEADLMDQFVLPSGKEMIVDAANRANRPDIIKKLGFLGF